ncbi:MAG: enoyl-CoA hydratase/isomerase family protein [Bradymonadia bacterium]
MTTDDIKAEGPVKLSTEGALATLTIDRPKALNALNRETLEALEATIAEVAAKDEIRCLIVTGGGQKSFVAGADIAEMQTMGPQQARAFAGLGHRVLAALEALPIPVIAAVNGYCLGGGCELALACDLVYAAENARFGQPEVKLGLMPGFGGTQRLTRRVGAMQAMELVFSGRQIKAPEALRLGLCLAVFSADELMAEVTRVARGIASQGPVAVRASKMAIRQGIEAPLAVANSLEQEAFAVLFDSADTQEGLSAFLEKRPPAFKNQ